MSTRLAAIGIAALFLVGCGQTDPGAASSDKPNVKPPADNVRITGVRMDDRKPDGTGTMYVQTSNGQETMVSSGVVDSWHSFDNLSIYYSFYDQPTGSSVGGESVYRYLLSNRSSELVFESDKIVTYVREVKATDTKSLLIVELVNPEKGTLELAVADPARGRVLTVKNGQFIDASAGSLKVGVLSDQQAKDFQPGQTQTPTKVQSYDLDELLAAEAVRTVP